MTLQELIKDLSVKAGIDTTNIDYAAFIGASALKDIEVPKVVGETLNKGLFTKDSAINNPDIYGELDTRAKGKYFGIIDTRVNATLDAFGEYFTEEQKTEIKNERDTPKRLELITKYLPQAVKEKNKAVGSSKPSEEDLRKIEAEYNTKLLTKDTEWQTKLTQKETEFRDKLISKDISQMIFGFNLIDNIPGGKDYLANAITDKLRQTYHLEPNEEGGLEIRRKDDPTKEVYINNTKVGIKDVLSEQLKDFVKKSDVPPTGTNGVTPANPFSVQTKPAQAMTIKENALAEARKLNAQLKASVMQQ